MVKWIGHQDHLICFSYCYVTIQAYKKSHQSISELKDEISHVFSVIEHYVEMSLKILTKEWTSVESQEKECCKYYFSYINVITDTTMTNEKFSKILYFIHHQTNSINSKHSLFSWIYRISSLMFWEGNWMWVR